MVQSAAIVAALFYGWYCSAVMYGWWQPLCSPLGVGLGVGLILGDPGTGIMLGGTIQAIYLGVIAPGGAVPAEPQLAAAIAIPVAMLTNMDINVAVALAVPLGILGSFLTVVRYIICDFFVAPAEKHAAKADIAGLWRFGVLYPAVVKFVLGFVIVYASVVMGVDALDGIINSIPDWLNNGLSVAGGLLPAIGIALTIMIINKSSYIPLFVIGYFLVQYAGLGTMACAIFAVSACLFITLFRMDILEQTSDDDNYEDEDENEGTASIARTLTPVDVNKTIFYWLLFSETAYCYQRMQGLAYASALAPALKKLYPGEENKDKLAAALLRESAYFNTEGAWGSSIVGVSLAMEEEQALTGAMSEEQANTSITSIKVGFMGPLAGIGDSIDWATGIMLAFSIALPYCLEYSVGGIVPLLVFVGYMTAISFTMGNLGYRLGSTAVTKFFTSGLTDRLVECASMVGMFMMGALASSYVSVALVSESVQGTLDSIVPGLLPLLAVFVLYFVFKKITRRVPIVTLSIIVLALILSIVGIL